MKKVSYSFFKKLNNLILISFLTPYLKIEKISEYLSLISLKDNPLLNKLLELICFLIPLGKTLPVLFSNLKIKDSNCLLKTVSLLKPYILAYLLLK